MAKSINNNTSIKGFEKTRVKEYMKERTALFGLIGWEEIVKTEIIKRELIISIHSLHLADKIIINGNEYKKEA